MTPRIDILTIIKILYLYTSRVVLFMVAIFSLIVVICIPCMLAFRFLIWLSRNYA